MGWLKSSLQGARSSDRRIPLARTEDLAIEEFEDELLVYDRKEQRAHCLGVTAARVWRACDGRTEVGRLADALDLSRDTVLRALDELEASQLLDVPEVQVVDGNGNGITRRQLTARSVRIGAAAAAGPLIYSIAVPTAAAQASPTEFACAIYSVSGCGTATGGGSVAGCCCCCRGCSGTSCVIGAPVDVCPTNTDCPNNCNPGSCSAGPGAVAPQPTGCCGQSGVTQCGCAFSSSGGAGGAGNLCGTGSFTCSATCPPGGVPGASGCGAGCCDTSTGSAPFPGCAPGVTNPNCVPCCNGFPLTDAATYGCCVPGTTDTCAPAP